MVRLMCPFGSKEHKRYNVHVKHSFSDIVKTALLSADKQCPKVVYEGEVL